MHVFRLSVLAVLLSCCCATPLSAADGLHGDLTASLKLAGTPTLSNGFSGGTASIWAMKHFRGRIYFAYGTSSNGNVTKLLYLDPTVVNPDGSNPTGSEGAISNIEQLSKLNTSGGRLHLHSYDGYGAQQHFMRTDAGWQTITVNGTGDHMRDTWEHGGWIWVGRADVGAPFPGMLRAPAANPHNAFTAFTQTVPPNTSDYLASSFFEHRGRLYVNNGGVTYGQQTHALVMGFSPTLDRWETVHDTAETLIPASAQYVSNGVVAGSISSPVTVARAGGQDRLLFIDRYQGAWSSAIYELGDVSDTAVAIIPSDLIYGWAGFPGMGRHGAFLLQQGRDILLLVGYYTQDASYNTVSTKMLVYRLIDPDHVTNASSWLKMATFTLPKQPYGNQPFEVLDGALYVVGSDWAVRRLNFPSLSYASWISAWLPGSTARGTTDTPAGDGFTNLYKYGTGLPPASVCTDPLAVTVGGAATSVTFPTNAQATDITWVLQALESGAYATVASSSDRTAWTVASGVTAARQADGTILVTDTRSPQASRTTYRLLIQQPGSAPAITAQPADTTVAVGSTASFTVAASGSPVPTLQWQSAAPGSSTFAAISGATSATYTTPAATAAMHGTRYRCVATNSGGSATSAAATLSVATPPSFATHPAGVTVTEPATATFIVAVSGSPAPTLQWQSAPSGSSSFTNISGATGSSYTTAATTPAMNGMRYRCVASNVGGTSTSNAATLSVTADTTAPTLVSAAAQSPTGVLVVFSEAVEVASAQQAANYALSGSVTVSAAAVQGDPTRVLLTTSAMTGGATYTLNVANVRDRAAMPNTMTAASTTFTMPDINLALTATASSTGSFGSNTPNLVNDGDAATYWRGSTSWPQEVVLTWSSAQTFNRVVVTAPDANVGAWRIDWWDGAAWVNLVASNSGNPTGTWNVSTVTSTKVKWVAETAGSDRPQLKEFEVYLIGSGNAAPVIAEGASTPLTVLEDGSGTVELTASDGNGDTLTWSIATQGTKGTATASGTGTAKTVSYAPSANQTGSDSFVVQVSDGNGGTDTITVNVTITAVNDAPSFTKGANQTVLEDAGARTVSGWATAISAGPSDESAQTLAFSTSNTNTALFSVQPAIAASGTLTYTPAANANGTATVTVTLTDNGGTANGGVATSAAQTFTITVTAVNDAPSFTKGANQTVAEDAGARTVSGWATAISAGPSNESGQTLTFSASNTNAALFSVQPAIAANGTLTYTPAANANGSATVTVTLTDNGGTANGGVATSPAQTFTITVTAVNDAPVLATAIPDQAATVGTAFSSVVPAGTFSDVDGDTLTWSSNETLGWLTFTPSTRTFSGTPASGDVAATTITVTVSDGTLTASDAFVLSVSAATNAAPTVATVASATPSPVTGTTTSLSVLGADDAGEPALTYTWSTTAKPTGAADPTFSVNGSNAAKATTATFAKAGSYTLRATIRDAGNLTATSAVTVTVAQTATAVAVTPSSATLVLRATQAFAASVRDQFGDALATQPAMTWSVPTGTGSVSTAGVYTAPGSAGTATVQAAAGGVSGTAAVSAVVSTLPSPWTGVNVGTFTPLGTSTVSGSGVYTLTAAGSDIWNRADQFHFAHQGVTGDCAVIAKVTGLTNTNAWAKAGVMIRETTAAGSRHAFLCVTPGSGVAFQRRLTTDGTSAHTSGGSGTAPVWVKLERVGNVISAYRSADGQAWTFIAQATVTMAADVRIGLAVTSHASGMLTTATFSDVTVIGVAAAGG